MLRTVSLIASATEIISALGLREWLVGISHECDYPVGIEGLPKLSAPKVDPELPSAAVDRGVREIVRDGLSVYRIDVEELQRLRPDVIVTQDHCEVCAVSLSDVEGALCELDLRGTRVVTLHPHDLADVRSDILKVAQGLGASEQGRRVVGDMDAKLRAIEERGRRAPRTRVALIEWLAPPMIAGGWMPELARMAGGAPVIVESAHRFEEVTWSDIAAADPDTVVVIPCGFDVARSLRELEDPDIERGMRSISAVRRGCCFVVDGNAYFNRPGPRLADSAEILAGVLHPELFAGHTREYRDVVAQWPVTS
ncbi:MAG: ABC transporter substrate-binding protein [Gemmatimonadota bacterium]|nr:ABC transporter substrate-binding protein [Gemmatimonadota bacterium]